MFQMLRKSGVLKSRGAAVLLAILGVVAAGAIKVWGDYKSLPDLPLFDEISVSTMVLDRNEHLLRAFTSADDKWRLPVHLKDIDPFYFEMLYAFEDKRFKDHMGIDPLALLRAGFQGLANGRIVSGGSTLTMQVARLLDEQPTRTMGRKYIQLLKAVQLEGRHSKDEILEFYLLRAPFGGNLEGIRAASLTWFGKEPRRLTTAEAALLVALPQSPESRRPDRFAENAKRARNRVIARAAEAGLISSDEAVAASREPVRRRRHQMPFWAAHESRRAVAENPDKHVHHLTLRRDLQSGLEQLARRKVTGFPAPVSIAMIVADHQSGDILASVGAPDLLDEARQGHMDMTRAIRSPGSALKPLIYGLAFEEGIGLPDSLIVDRPTRIGSYTPTNFDMSYQGTVTLREALQKSLNTPAVQLLEAVGPARLIARLKRAGASPVFQQKQSPGLAISLGGLGVSLRDLVKLYAAFGQLGETVSLTSCARNCATDQQKVPRPGKVLSEKPAWWIQEILSGLPQSGNSASGVFAYKTGTAYGYRDAWALGFDGQHVVGIWVGRPDGSPVPGQTGASAAVPILQEVFQKLGRERAPLMPARSAVSSNETPVGVIPAPLRFARVRGRPVEGAAAGKLEISFPPNGAELLLMKNDNKAPSAFEIRVSGGRRPYSLLANGKVVATSNHSRRLYWPDPAIGYANLSVVDGQGSSTSVSVKLLSENQTQ